MGAVKMGAAAATPRAVRSLVVESRILDPRSHRLRVAVVGAGIGGLAVARGLQSLGHDCVVYEQAKALRLSGAAVTIWPNGSAALTELRIPLEGLGQRIDRFELRSAQGRMMGAIDGVRVARRFGVPAMVIPRRRLPQRLAEGLASGSLRFAHPFRAVRLDESGATVEFENGDSATVDLVVGADGHRSAVRTAVLGGGPAEPTGWAEWQGLSQVSTRLTDGHQALLLTDKDGACGLMPAGEGRLQWWFTVPGTPDTPRPSSVVSMLRERFGSWMPPVPELLDGMSDAEVNFWPYVRHRVPRSLFVGRVVLLGDAVHAMPPTMAQGANQTLEDAMVLTAQLRSAPLSSALRGYDHARRRRVAAVSRLAARSPAQDPDAAWVRSLVVPTSLSTWFFGSLLRAVGNSLGVRTPHDGRTGKSA